MCCGFGLECAAVGGSGERGDTPLQGKVVCRHAASCVLLRGLLSVWGNHSRHARPQKKENPNASMNYVNVAGAGNTRRNVGGALMSRTTEVILSLG